MDRLEREADRINYLLRLDTHNLYKLDVHVNKVRGPAAHQPNTSREQHLTKPEACVCPTFPCVLQKTRGKNPEPPTLNQITNTVDRLSRGSRYDPYMYIYGKVCCEACYVWRAVPSGSPDVCWVCEGQQYKYDTPSPDIYRRDRTTWSSTCRGCIALHGDACM